MRRVKVDGPGVRARLAEATAAAAAAKRAGEAAFAEVRERRLRQVERHQNDPRFRQRSRADLEKQAERDIPDPDIKRLIAKAKQEYRQKALPARQAALGLLTTSRTIGRPEPFLTEREAARHTSDRATLAELRRLNQHFELAERRAEVRALPLAEQERLFAETIETLRSIKANWQPVTSAEWERRPSLPIETFEAQQRARHDAELDAFVLQEALLTPRAYQPREGEAPVPKDIWAHEQEEKARPERIRTLVATLRTPDEEREALEVAAALEALDKEERLLGVTLETARTVGRPVAPEPVSA